MKKNISLAFVFSLFFQPSLLLADYFKVIEKVSGSSSEIISVETVKSQIKYATPEIVQNLPYFLAEGNTPTKQDQSFFKETLKSELNSQEKIFLKKLAAIRNLESAELQSVEVRSFVSDGPINNRIHLTILGDGYTLNEKEKFFADAKRITENLFTESTFDSYLPLFQVHAVFVASNESGLGDGSPKDTAFELYRNPKGSKRAIYPGNQSALERALAYAPKTDYPIVIANDDYYGGLGGRYAISTRSEKSGMIVLRHELGHNFGNVGEEYDGGSVYSGANSSSDARAEKWSHWRNDQSTYTSRLIGGYYLWQNLKNNSYKTTFQTESNETVGLELSTVGWSSPDDVHVSVNGQKIDLGGTYHYDRNFYIIDGLDVNAKTNTLEIKENIQDQDNVLATAYVYTYPKDYNFNESILASFSTYSESGRKTFRPTHNSCIMRNMMVKHFCAVDQENMWHQFLKRMTLIDGLTQTADEVQLTTPNLPGLTITWFNENNIELTFLKNNKTVFKKSITDRAKKLKVVVELRTPEVRKYDQKFKTEKTISL